MSMDGSRAQDLENGGIQQFVGSVVDVGDETVEQLGMSLHPLHRPGQGGGGRLVAGRQEGDQLVGDLRTASSMSRPRSGSATSTPARRRAPPGRGRPAPCRSTGRRSRRTRDGTGGIGPTDSTVPNPIAALGQATRFDPSRIAGGNISRRRSSSSPSAPNTARNMTFSVIRVIDGPAAKVRSCGHEANSSTASCSMIAS